MADPNITLRVAELRQPVIERVQYGLEQAMREAEEAFKVTVVTVLALVAIVLYGATTFVSGTPIWAIVIIVLLVLILMK